MPYSIPITDDRKRDATVEAFSPRPAASATYQTSDGAKPEHRRLIKANEHTSFASLLAKHDDDLDALAEGLIAGDPEVPLELVGSHLQDANRVYVKADGTVLYAARVLRVSTDVSGEETGRDDFVDVEATVSADSAPLPWTGKLLDVNEVVRRFALVRKVQLRHVNGLTYDFLYEIAKSLSEANKLLLVGSGKKGNQPLIFQRNGAPFRGFLEGRVDGAAFRLVLHLSNMEIKALPKVEKVEE